MRLTIDSTDALPDVLSVVGAMYGVQLEAVGEPAPVEEQAAAPRSSRGGRRRSGGAAPARRRTSRRSRETSDAATANAPRAATAATGDAARSADIRAWGRANGYQVNERGRIPASVVAAYEQAHG